LLRILTVIGHGDPGGPLGGGDPSLQDTLQPVTINKRERDGISLRQMKISMVTIVKKTQPVLYPIYICMLLYDGRYMSRSGISVQWLNICKCRLDIKQVVFSLQWLPWIFSSVVVKFRPFLAY
jgi:hypothetical protein